MQRKAELDEPALHRQPSRPGRSPRLASSSERNRTTRCPMIMPRVSSPSWLGGSLSGLGDPTMARGNRLSRSSCWCGSSPVLLWYASGRASSTPMALSKVWPHHSIGLSTYPCSSSNSPLLVVAPPSPSARRWTCRLCSGSRTGPAACGCALGRPGAW